MQMYGEVIVNTTTSQTALSALEPLIYAVLLFMAQQAGVDQSV
jgi:hypothetical protein